jgi:hypothetical protein
MSDSFLVSDNGNGSDISTDIVVDQITVADENLISDDTPVQVEIVSTGVGIGSVANLRDLLDVNSSNLNTGTNRFVLTYNSSTDKFEFSNPDAVIDSAVGITTTDPAPVGLSSSTIDYLDDALDNKIDLDAGEW